MTWIHHHWQAWRERTQAQWVADKRVWSRAVRKAREERIKQRIEAREQAGRLNRWGEVWSSLLPKDKIKCDGIASAWGVKEGRPYLYTDKVKVLELTRALSFDAVCLRGKCDADHSLGYRLMLRFVPELVRRMQAARLQSLNVYGATG